MPTPSTRIVLIRHGESRAQVEGFVSGHSTCTGLSDTGRLQAERLRDRLIESGELAGVDAVATSILPRARETAEILIPALGVDTPDAECGLCELHPGDAEGMQWKELRTRFPTVGDPDDPFRRRYAGMETWAEMYARAGEHLSRAAATHPGGRVVVVAHGGTIGASFVSLGGLPIGRGIEFVRAAVNTSITEWELSSGAWTLVRFNDASHVANV